MRLNNYQTTLSNAITASDITITIPDTTNLSAGDYLTFIDNLEIIKITSVDSATQLTVQRGIGGTTATDHSAGAVIQMRITAQHLDDIQDDINTHKADTNNPHSVTASQIGAITEIEDDITPKLGGELNAQEHSIGFTEQTITSSSGSATIDWKNGNKATITLTEDVTLSFTNPSYACNLQLKIVQDSNGEHSLTFPTIKWAGSSAPTLTTAANAIDIVSLYFDGTNYYGVASLNFS